MEFVNFLRDYISRCPNTLIEPICTILLNPCIHSTDFNFIKKNLLNPHISSPLLLDQYKYIIAVYELSRLPPPQLTKEITDIKNDHF